MVKVTMCHAKSWNAILVLGIFWMTTSAYESRSRYVPAGTYLPVTDFHTWLYPEDGTPSIGAKNRAPRYYGPSMSEGIVKNRRRNYGELQPQTYSQSFNELDSRQPSGRNRWFSSLKRRQSPTSSLKLDPYNRVQMGVSNSLCDDAKTNLTVDWDLSPVNYTCYHPETRLPRSFDLEPLLECERLPPRYVPGHVCMDQRIPYRDAIPTHGDHRPLWPKFGEYLFVPRERWLHNIEHGAIVMLYHPCAYPSEVNRLRTLVKGCVEKHVITPSTLVPPERPLALVAWGCRLLLSAVDDDAVMNFIETRAHHGPEGTYTKEGQYDLKLLKSAKLSGNGAKYGYSKVTCSAIDRSRL